MELDFSDFVESVWPSAEELLPLPNLAPVNAPFRAPTLCDGLTDADFARVLFDEQFSSTYEEAAAPAATPAKRKSGSKRNTLCLPDDGSYGGTTAAPKPITPDKRRERSTQKAECRRYWTDEERSRFHEAMRRHGADLNAIAREVGTRSITQVRTHIQKYHLRLIREYQAKKKAAAHAADDAPLPTHPV